MNATLLVVEDDADIANLIRLYLEREGVEVVHATTGEAALELVGSRPFDMAILDINLPGIDGFEVLQAIRTVHRFPVLMLTARKDDVDAVQGLGSGADEYVTKPFSPRVLVARVRAHLRRSRTRSVGAAAPEVIRCGPLELDPGRELVSVAGTPVQLAPREYAVLRYLLESRGQPRNAEQIYDAVWENAYGDVASVPVHIQRIRRKIEPDPAHPQLIRTRHGYGYFCPCEDSP